MPVLCIAKGCTCLVDAETVAMRWAIDVGADADHVRYDATAKRVCFTVGGLYAVDPVTGKKIGQLPIDVTISFVHRVLAE